MKKYLGILLAAAGILIFPHLSSAALITENTFTNASSGFWNVGGVSPNYFFNLGKPLFYSPTTTTYLSFNSYNPDFVCDWANSVINSYSDPTYSTLTGSASVAEIFNVDGSSDFGDEREQQNTTTTFHYGSFPSITLNPSYYYRFYPTCNYSVSATNYLNIYNSAPTLINGATTTLQFVWATDASTTLAISNSTSSPSPTAPTFAFSYPVNGTSVPLFSPFLLHANGLIPTDNYITQVTWYGIYPDGSVTQSLTNYDSSAIQGTLVQGAPQTGANIISNGIQVARTDFGFDFAASTTPIVANAALYDVTGQQVQGVLVATTSIEFNLVQIVTSSPSGQPDLVFTIPTQNGSGQITGNQQTTLTQVVNLVPSISSSTDCGIYGNIFFTSSTLPALSCYFEQAFTWSTNFLLTPNPVFTAQAISAVNQYQTVFPFSLAVGLATAVQSSTNVTAAPQGWILPVMGTPVTVLDGSTISNVFGSSTVSTYFTVSRAVLWTGTALLILLH